MAKSGKTIDVTDDVSQEFLDQLNKLRRMRGAEPIRKKKKTKKRKDDDSNNNSNDNNTNTKMKEGGLILRVTNRGPLYKGKKSGNENS
jgi:hypothetical protein